MLKRIIIVLVVFSFVGTAEMCATGYWKCSDGKCIPHPWRCDHEPDCDDGSDERGCDIACQDDHFQCASGVCIPSTWRCDDHPDCSDGSDELNCNATVTDADPTIPEVPLCKSDRFLCDGKTCIPLEWLCDGEADCKDNTDEEFCSDKGNTTTPTPLTSSVAPSGTDENGNDEERNDGASDSVPTHTADICDAESFFCDGNRCVSNSFVCNGVNECIDQTDEQNCSRKCRSDEIVCLTSRTCIPEVWKCDGESDCDDNSDENNCNIAGVTEVPMMILRRASTTTTRPKVVNSSESPNTTEINPDTVIIEESTSPAPVENDTLTERPAENAFREINLTDTTVEPEAIAESEPIVGPGTITDATTTVKPGTIVEPVSVTSTPVEVAEEPTSIESTQPDSTEAPVEEALYETTVEPLESTTLL